MTTCAQHRDFLGALADGELDLVPAGTIDHVHSCADCSMEVQNHRQLSHKLREAIEHLPGATAKTSPAASHSRLIAVSAASAAAVVVAVVAAGWFALSRPDPVQAAVTASTQSLQLQSTDPAQVQAWCVRTSGRNLPVVQVDGMTMVGARMDRVPSTDIVTVAYISPGGTEVTVSWLEGQAPGGSGVEEKDVSGRHVLLVHAPRGTAVIGGSSIGAMWEAAAALEAS